MASQTKKSRLSECHRKNEVEVDRISDLPGNVLDQIFSYLSIRESARTSLLSTKWRHKWESVPTLVFNDRSFSSYKVKKLVSIIDRILMLHVGPIHLFELSISDDIPFEEIDKWIMYISRRSIKQLVIVTSHADEYLIPACLFSCESLQHLKIYNCDLTPPSKFKGFKNLESLTIEESSVDPNVLENLISGSTVLEKLDLIDLELFSQLNVNAPNLRSFVFNGSCLGVIFKNSPLLSVLSITDTTEFECWDGRFSDNINFFNLISNIPFLRSLTIGVNYLSYLARGEIPKELPIKFVNLVYLSIDISYSSFNETSALLCLLRSSPNLKEVHIEGQFFDTFAERYSPDDGDKIISSIWDAGDLNFQLSSVKLFKMCRFIGTQEECDLIKFVLLAAPNLNSFILKYLGSSSGDAKSMLKKLLRFKRASPQAEIIFLES